MANESKIFVKVFGTVYEQHEEVFEIDNKEPEDACIEAEERWIKKHGSPESIDSDIIGIR